MSKHTTVPPVAWDLASAVLGAIGLGLFILPVLALPILGSAMLLGLIGILIACLGGATSLRLSVAGLLFSGLAFSVVVAITLAQNGYFAPRQVIPQLRPADGRPYIPPPAPPRSGPVRSDGKTVSSQARFIHPVAYAVLRYPSSTIA